MQRQGNSRATDSCAPARTGVHATRDTVVGRVIQSGRLLRARTERGILLLEPPRSSARSMAGDWVRPLCGDLVQIEPYLGRRSDVACGRIRQVLPRRNVVTRGRGEGRAPQPMVANVDEGWIVCGLDRDPRLRQLPRYRAILGSASIDVVVVLNKIDLVTTPAPSEREFDGEREFDSERAFDVEPVCKQEGAGSAQVMVSALTGAGLDQLVPRLVPGRVIALFGASGAGKSTLVNALIGSTIGPKTADVRAADARGRHTTTSSCLWETPQGAFIIDTPGSRELGVTGCDVGLRRTFQQIEEYAQACRFSDCRHQREPGCAVRAALDQGVLAADEFLTYLELRQEGGVTARRKREEKY